MSDLEDRELEDYLHRKSALSLGYKRIYVEAPPAELDRAVTARARRALRFLGPALIAAGIAIGIVLVLNTGIGRIMGALVMAERQQKEAAEREPITVTIVEPIVPPRQTSASPTAEMSREQWLAKIKSLRASGNAEAANIEQAKFNKAYPAEQPVLPSE